MDDLFDKLGEREIADACAYADGTLPAARRMEVEARVLASPELTALVQRQRRALALTAALAADQPPPSLRGAIGALRPEPGGARRARRRRRGLALSAAGALVAVLVAVAVLSGGGGPAGSQVASAADLALLSPSGPAPAAGGRPGRLDVSFAGITFPDYRGAYGWSAAGTRPGTVGGRQATVVYYEKAGRRIGYAIVDGAALPLPDGAARTVRSGVAYLSFAYRGQNVVTWREAGHTCVLAGPVPATQLVALASWAGPSSY